jgi:hypothetical protein
LRLDQRNDREDGNRTRAAARASAITSSLEDGNRTRAAARASAITSSLGLCQTKPRPLPSEVPTFVKRSTNLRQANTDLRQANTDLCHATHQPLSGRASAFVKNIRPWPTCSDGSKATPTLVPKNLRAGVGCKFDLKRGS